MKESCGVIAISKLEGEDKDVSSDLICGLQKLQHRGQLSTGITTFSQERNPKLITTRGMGLVSQVFEHGISHQCSGNAGIGHVRYATSGGNSINEAQPFQFNAGIEVALAFNGNIANFRELIRQYLLRGIYIDSNIDTAVIRQVVSDHLSEGSFMDSPHALARTLDGAYSLVMINGLGQIIAYRDHHGFKPLCYTINNSTLLIASESVALRSYGSVVETLQPGCSIWYSPETGDVRVNRILAPQTSRCFFEFVYFAHEDSIIDEYPVGKSRRNMGEYLADIETVIIDDDCVAVSIPSSANKACEGFADALGIELKPGIKKKSNSGRTFIEADARREKVRNKFEIDPSVFTGKKIFLVDDSLVRSTTVRVLIEEIKRVSTPKEIHIRIACPPISAPCFYGIDIPDVSELFANGFSTPSEIDLPEYILQRMAKELDVNSIKFLPNMAVIKSIGGENRDLCMACVSGLYPTSSGNQRYKEGK